MMTPSTLAPERPAIVPSESLNHAVPKSRSAGFVDVPRRGTNSAARQTRGPSDNRWRHVKPAGNRSWFYQLAKRAGDIVGGLLILWLLSPVIFAAWLTLMITSRGRPFFVQERVGECGRTFRMYKFRTMRLDADKMQHQVANEKDGPIFKNQHDPRITRVGRFLRSTSIDEMPQLLNVLKGDMSLVGPRPPIPKEVEQYQPWQTRRLAVKPGLTCFWQVNGRSEIGFDDWMRMDVRYTRSQDLTTDLKLLVKTPGSVLSRRGAY